MFSKLFRNKKEEMHNGQKGEQVIDEITTRDNTSLDESEIIAAIITCIAQYLDVPADKLIVRSIKKSPEWLYMAKSEQLQ